MTAYRDQYASIFNDGRNVILFGISTDSPEELASWAFDSDYDFLFGSDPTGAAYAAVGGSPRDNGMPGSRAVVVVGPDGRVAEVIPSFNPNDPQAYRQLEAAVDRVTPEPEN